MAPRRRSPTPPGSRRSARYFSRSKPQGRRGRRCSPQRRCLRCRLPPARRFWGGCGAWRIEAIKVVSVQSWGLTAHGLFILQCSNYLLSVGLQVPTKELPLSVAKNVEFLRRLPKVNKITGLGDFGRNLTQNLRSPLVETTDFGSNPGGIKMLSFVPSNLQQPPALVVVLHGWGQTAAGYDLGAGWSTLAKH